MSIRIIAGAYKGHCIDAPASARPTLSRFRQSLFDVLESIDSDFFHNKIVLDCFAGSGALGLEAISRGADFAYFVDKDKEAFNVIKNNIEKLHVSKVCKVICCDIAKIRNCENVCANIAFVDPPYGKVSIEKTVKYLINTGWMSQNSYIITEEHADHVEPLPFLKLIKTKHAGISVFRVFLMCPL